MPARGLSAKQEKFCVEFLKTGNASAAYREAGYGKRMSPKTINEQACRLAKNGKVVARIAALRTAMESRSQITLEGHLTELASLRDAAKADKQFSAAITAETNRGKASGFYSRGEDPGDLPPPADGEGEVTLDKARRVAFLLQAGVRITVSGSTASST